MTEIYICLGIAFLLSVSIINGIVTTAAKVLSESVSIELNNLFGKLHAEIREMKNEIRELKLQLGEHAAITEPTTRDRLLYDVAIWAIECNGLSTSALARHYSMSFSRAGRIVDQLHSMGICGDAQGLPKPRPILATMSDVIELKKQGAFDK